MLSPKTGVELDVHGQDRIVGHAAIRPERRADKPMSEMVQAATEHALGWQHLVPILGKPRRPPSIKGEALRFQNGAE